MILELVGSRVLAPWVGTSLVVWTSLIGIILASLSIGYYYGGVLADQSPSIKTYAHVIFVAGICIAVTALFKQGVFEIVAALTNDTRVIAVVVVSILFAPASILLGAITPYAAKLTLHEMKHVGTTVGRLYALSTVGSIVGTFSAGFVLIAFLGSTTILFILSLVLIVTAVFVYPRKRLGTDVAIVALIMFSLFAGMNASHAARRAGTIEQETSYQHVKIYTTALSDGRQIRALRTDHFTFSSAEYLDSDELVFDVLKMFHLITVIRPDMTRALMIGGGAYSYPMSFLKEFPSAIMDVVEIDPQLTSLARQYFHLVDDSRLHIIHEDGRVFLNHADTTLPYNVIFIDAFHSLTPPYQLTTREAAEKMYGMLDDHGAVLINIVGSVEGDKGQFLRAEYATFSAVFPHVYVFPVTQPTNGTVVQNLLLVALKDKQPLVETSSDVQLQTYLKQRWLKNIPIDKPILTDDYAPVDQYFLSLYQ